MQSSKLPIFTYFLPKNKWAVYYHFQFKVKVSGIQQKNIIFLIKNTFY